MIFVRRGLDSKTRVLAAALYVTSFLSFEEIFLMNSSANTTFATSDEPCWISTGTWCGSRGGAFVVECSLWGVVGFGGRGVGRGPVRVWDESGEEVAESVAASEA